MAAGKGVPEHAKCTAFDAFSVLWRIGEGQNDLRSAVQILCSLVQGQSKRITHQRRLANQVVPAELVFIDLDVHRLIKVFFDGPHQKQVIINVTLGRRFREKQHSCVIADVECDGVVLATVGHRLTFRKNTPASLRHRTACRDLLQGVRSIDVDPSLMSPRTIIVIAFAISVIAAVFLFTSAVPQDSAYHQFSDSRASLGVPNFWNVLSNLPFLIVGAAGLVFVNRNADKVCVSTNDMAYYVFFIGISLTAFGSSFYHLSPSNETLLWDRLPMTIGFAGLVTIIVAEFVSARAARMLLVPLLIVGFASVEYWAWTESRGVGDLRPYALVQFLPMLMIPVILLTHKPLIGETRYYWWMLAFYVLAKLLEFFDADIFAFGYLISGHSLKHVVAAMTPAVFLYALITRRRLFT